MKNKNQKDSGIKPDEDYLGIPRAEIPWYPSIDYSKCNSCKTCFEFCRLKTYSYVSGPDKVSVANPYNCVVGCNGCEDKCPEGAISFPSTKVIDKVRKKYKV
jgi:NAD-dependent dihydropyrimidine dehydrogenase PreA subunit